MPEYNWQWGSSPRPWGCFSRSYTGIDWIEVFPTPVGVFLSGSAMRISRTGLPHARGGVSLTYQQGINRMLSSPRPWGCFLGSPIGSMCHIVFPTPVGVFLALLYLLRL